MGAFYANAISSGLVEDGMCCVDSSEVLENIEKQKRDEEKERLKRSMAADGLLSMNNPSGSGITKKRVWMTVKIRDPIISDRIHILNISDGKTWNWKNSGPFSGAVASSFHPPTKKSKASGGKKSKKTGPNLTGISTALSTDADRNAALIEIGMEPQAGSSENSGSSQWQFSILILFHVVSCKLFLSSVLHTGNKAPHNWTDEQTDTLWSYVEKFQLQLYHGKDNMTRPQIVAKITALLSMYALAMKSFETSCMFETEMLTGYKFCRYPPWHRCEQETSGRQNLPYWASVQGTWGGEIQWCSRPVVVASWRMSHSSVRWVAYVCRLFNMLSCLSPTNKTHTEIHKKLYLYLSYRGTPINQAEDDFQFWPRKGTWFFPCTITGCGHPIECKETHIQNEPVWQSPDIPESFCEYSHNCVDVCMFVTWCRQVVTSQPVSAGWSCQRDAQWK